MKQEVKNWVDSATYDLETAEHMFNTGRYIHTVFMCHLAIEKLLKAKVEEQTGKTPPRTHNLRYLVKLSGIEPGKERFELISKLSDISIVTRYPEDFGEVQRACSQEVAQRYLKETKEAFQWIKQLLTP